MKKTVYTYFVYKACSLCSLFFENRYPYVNEVLKQSIINGRMEIVGILLARIYLQRLKNYRVVIHIHNLCIILILSFLLGILVSQRRIKCAFKNCGEPGGHSPPPKKNFFRGARGGLPLLPLGGVGGMGGGGGSINHV